MPSFNSLTAVLAFASAAIAAPQYSWGTAGFFPTGTAPLHTAPVKTGVSSTGKIVYPTVGPKYTNSTSVAPMPTMTSESSSTLSSFESLATTTIYVTAEDSDCDTPTTSYSETTTLFSTLYVSSATPVITSSSPTAKPVASASATSSAVPEEEDEGEDCEDEDDEPLSTSINSSYTGKIHYYSTASSSVAAPVKPTAAPSLSWTGNWNGTVTSGSVYPTGSGKPYGTGKAHGTGKARGTGKVHGTGFVPKPTGYVF